MAKPTIPPELRRQIAAVTAKRPKIVLDHILAHGQVTTDELQQQYGYEHPPRAARDVREQGIPLKTTMITVNGRRMAAYTLDVDAVVNTAKLGGRRPFPKSLKRALIEKDGERCYVCGTPYPGNALQVDHRIPYEVSGDVGDIVIGHYMLVCRTCNRNKSWSCEHCVNWNERKDPSICQTCMWASPLDYTHLAMEERRQVTVTWLGKDTKEYDALRAKAQAEGLDLPDYLKRLLESREGA